MILFMFSEGFAIESKENNMNFEGKNVNKSSNSDSEWNFNEII